MLIINFNTISEVSILAMYDYSLSSDIIQSFQPLLSILQSLLSLNLTMKFDVLGKYANLINYE